MRVKGLGLGTYGLGLECPGLGLGLEILALATALRKLQHNESFYSVIREDEDVVLNLSRTRRRMLTR